MARIVLVTGGCRSGKSAYAQQLAESLPGPRVFVATCPVTDEEMRQRHRSSTAGHGKTAAGRRSKSSATWPASSAMYQAHAVCRPRHTECA